MLNLCGKYLPASLFLVIIIHVNPLNKSPPGFKYTNEFRQLAIALAIFYFGFKILRIFAKYSSSSIAIYVLTLKSVTQCY